jgi:ankyrin repeat protein
MTSSIFDAIRQGDVAGVKELLAADPSSASGRSEQGVSALMLARYHGQREIADAILAAKRELDVFEAATFGKVERLRELLNRDPSLVNARSADTGTALHFASFFAQPACVRELLARSANPQLRAPGFGNVMALHSAVAGRSVEIVRMLLEAGADPNAKQDQGFSALHEAANTGDLEMARALAGHGADPKQRDDKGQTAVDLARAKHHEDVAAFLAGSVS